jgi:hypothetical protein
VAELTTGTLYNTEAYGNLFSDTSAPIRAVIILRSNLSVYNKNLFHIAWFVNSSPELTSGKALVKCDCRERRLDIPSPPRDLRFSVDLATQLHA